MVLHQTLLNPKKGLPRTSFISIVLLFTSLPLLSSSGANSPIVPEEVSYLYFARLQEGIETYTSLESMTDVVGTPGCMDTIIRDIETIRRYADIVNSLKKDTINNNNNLDLRMVSFFRFKNGRRSFVCSGYYWDLFRDGQRMEENQDFFYFKDSLLYKPYSDTYYAKHDPVYRMMLGLPPKSKKIGFWDDYSLRERYYLQKEHLINKLAAQYFEDPNQLTSAQVESVLKIASNKNEGIALAFYYEIFKLAMVNNDYRCFDIELAKYLELFIHNNRSYVELLKNRFPDSIKRAFHIIRQYNFISLSSVNTYKTPRMPMYYIALKEQAYCAQRTTPWYSANLRRWMAPDPMGETYYDMTRKASAKGKK